MADIRFPEYSEREPARDLADAIRAFWIAEGYPSIRVEARASNAHPDSRYHIKSNIGRNGLPPGPRLPPVEPLRHKLYRI